MRKTKIVCTLGPASGDKDVLLQLVEAGMNVARLNFSHGTHEDHGEKIDLVKEVEKDIGRPIGIMLDTKGPEIRTGDLKKASIELVKGEEIYLTTEDIQGTSDRISISYKQLPDDVEPGNSILIDDGLIELEVEEIKGKDIRCRIINGGTLGPHKGVNLPGISVKLPALTEKDKEDIRFGIRKGIQLIAVSFVRKAIDVLEIRQLLQDEGAGDIRIISKIENQEGVDNIDEIIKISDGIMIARGDLGVEIPPEKVPVIQKSMITKCNRAAIPVITATQMLESMIRNPRPTRAEASDVANAIFDGTDAIMLSGESAIGDYPVEAARTMARIATEIEGSLAYQEKLRKYKTPSLGTVTEAICFAARETAMDLKAECIITSTNSGLTARMVSRQRPTTPIIAVTHNEIVEHSLALSWGVYPLKAPRSKTTDEMIENAISAVHNHNLVEEGDLVTITAGVPVGISGTTNLIEVLVVGEQ